MKYSIKPNKIIKNEKFSISLNQIQDSNGKQWANNFLIVSPLTKGKKNLSGVGIAPIFNGKIGLIETYRAPIRRKTWELPRGFIDFPEENPKKAAQRELLEETGIRVPLNKIEQVASFYPEAGILASKINVYVASLKNAPTKWSGANEDGHHQFTFFSIREAFELYNKGKLLDPNTLLVLFWLKNKRSKGK